MAPATAIRAKFTVSSVETHQGARYDSAAGGYSPVLVNNVTLQPVFDPDPMGENARFYLATPCGQIVLNDVLPDVGGAFVVGKPYHVDFTRADVEAAPATGQGEARDRAAERLAGALRAMVDLWKDVETTDLPNEVLLALARANAALKGAREAGTSTGDGVETAEAGAAPGAASSAIRGVLAAVPHAEPAHVTAALAAFDRAGSHGGDLKGQLLAAWSDAVRSGASDGTAIDIALTIPGTIDPAADVPADASIALGQASTILRGLRRPRATASFDAPEAAGAEAKADALSSANDRVLAVVPNAKPAHVSAALSAYDAAGWSGGDLAARKAAASAAARQAGAGDVTALAIAAALPAAMGLGRMPDAADQRPAAVPGT